VGLAFPQGVNVTHIPTTLRTVAGLESSAKIANAFQRAVTATHLLTTQMLFVPPGLNAKSASV